jgi:hypothetical protein
VMLVFLRSPLCLLLQGPLDIVLRCRSYPHVLVVWVTLILIVGPYLILIFTMVTVRGQVTQSLIITRIRRICALCANAFLETHAPSLTPLLRRTL